MGAVLALSKGQKETLVGVQEEVEVLKVVFSLRPLRLASFAASYPCFQLLVVVVLMYYSCSDGVGFLAGHLQ